MGRHKGSQNATTPLKRRNPALHKRVVKRIRSVGAQNLADEAGVSKTCIYNIVNGTEGVSPQIESKVYKALKDLIKRRKEQDSEKEKELELEAEHALSV